MNYYSIVPSGGGFLLMDAKQLYMRKILRASHNHYNLLKHTQLYKNKRKYYIYYNLNKRKIILQSPVFLL